MPRRDLLESDNDSDSQQGDNNLVINKRYAKGFTLRKQRQELRNLPADADLSASSSDSDEDEVGALLTTKLDTNIMKTINALRSKDQRIYDPKVRFFEDKEVDDSDSDDNVTNQQRKPKRYKDVVREQALEQIEKGMNIMESDDDEKAGGEAHRLAYDKEQEDIRKSFLQSTQGLDEDESDKDDKDSGDDGLLVVKKRDPKEDEKYEQEFAQEIQRIEATLPEKDNEYVDPKGEVDDGSKFLLNYFKNRKWIDKDQLDDDDDDSSDEEVPTKRLQHADEELPMKSGNKEGNESDEASLDQLDMTDDFEAQYNFRFEEAGTQSGADFSLISYARGQTINTLRRKDDSRREKRLARKERKVTERKAKEEELKRLKNLKRKEMERKLREVKKVVGLAEQDADLDEAAILKLIEGDYDPEEFEKKMQETFGDDFYAKEDKEWKSDKDVKESLMRDEDGNLIVGDDNEGDMYDTTGDDAAEEDEGGTEVEETENEEWNEEDYDDGEEGGEGEEETELEKKIKAKMDEELYKLDYEDIIAGMPTRFKYRQVEPNNYGLTTEEILFARDTTLKQFVSLKKMAPYRDDGEYNVGGKRRRRFRDQLKHEIEEEFGESEKKKEAKPTDESQETNAVDSGAGSKKRKRKRSKKSTSVDIKEKEDAKIENAPTKEASKPVQGEETHETEKEDDPENATSEPKRKKKRRQKKKKSHSEEGHDDQAPKLDTECEQNDGTMAESTKVESPENGMAKTTVTAELDTKNGDESTKKAPKRSKKKEKKHKKEKTNDGKHDKKKKKAKKSSIEGISSFRLSSYGL